MLRYLDESGVSLCLPPAYTWTPTGSASQHRVPSRWGSQGRINLIGTLCLEHETERLEYHLMDGSCRADAVVGYLDALAAQTEQDGTPVVVVLDNAPFHRAHTVQQARARWEQQGLTLYYLPAYCPHLNRIEGVWKRLKGFLLPRRCYDSVAELTEAVLSSLRLLGAVEIHSQLGDT